MGEGLTLEEQKKNELELFISSVILLFTFAALSTFTGLIVLFMDVMALLIFRSTGMSGPMDIVCIVLLFLPLGLTLLLSYATVNKFAQGPVYAVLAVMVFFNLVLLFTFYFKYSLTFTSRGTTRSRRCTIFLN